MAVSPVLRSKLTAMFPLAVFGKSHLEYLTASTYLVRSRISAAMHTTCAPHPAGSQQSQGFALVRQINLEQQSHYFVWPPTHLA